MTKYKKLLIGVIVIIVVIVGWFFWGPGLGTPTTIYAKDTTIQGNLTVEFGTKTVLKNSATLTVEGDLTVNGALICDNGPTQLVVTGTLTVNRVLQCNVTDSSKLSGNGITVVAKRFNITKDAVIVSNGHVQMVTSEDKLVKDQASIDVLYEKAGQIENKELHIGPFTPIEQIPEGTKGRPTTENSSKQLAVSSKQEIDTSSYFAGIIKRAQATEAEPAVDNFGNAVPGAVKIGGKWIIGSPDTLPPFELDIPTPPGDIKKVILNFDFGGEDMTIQDFELWGPDAAPGTDDTNSSCTAKGAKGSDAMRMNVLASSVAISNFNLHLGDGGNGGEAVTKTDCEAASAIGGEGGLSGNFKIVAPQGFNVVGAFNIFPGRGGNGGIATATGKKGDDGCDGKSGGAASATGGKGADNNRLLTASGTINGKANIVVMDLVGGSGGDATASGGNGGNGTDPGCAGGSGGSASAVGGAGGNTNCAKFPCRGGNGGNASSQPGSGGNGGQGSKTEPGGNGGNGGDANITVGRGGTGVTANGTDGTIQNQTGGNGGNGGDGCGEGKGGSGGNGNPAGNKGADGKNLCTTETPPPPAQVVPSGPPATQTPPPTEQQKVKVIEYNGKYLPVAQLIVEDEEGCDGGQPHWHAGAGVVTATDGSKVADPGPDCGYGKTKDKPVIEVQVQINFRL